MRGWLKPFNCFSSLAIFGRRFAVPILQRRWGATVVNTKLWNCPHCAAHNADDREICVACETPRAVEHKMNEELLSERLPPWRQRPLSPVAERMRSCITEVIPLEKINRLGEWRCPNCETQNYISRRRCRRCRHGREVLCNTENHRAVINALNSLKERITPEEIETFIHDITLRIRRGKVSTTGWLCVHCKAANFAERECCGICGVPQAFRDVYLKKKVLEKRVEKPEEYGKGECHGSDEKSHEEVPEDATQEKNKKWKMPSKWLNNTVTNAGTNITEQNTWGLLSSPPKVKSTDLTHCEEKSIVRQASLTKYHSRYRDYSLVKFSSKSECSAVLPADGTDFTPSSSYEVFYGGTAVHAGDWGCSTCGECNRRYRECCVRCGISRFAEGACGWVGFSCNDLLVVCTTRSDGRYDFSCPSELTEAGIRPGFFCPSCGYLNASRTPIELLRDKRATSPGGTPRCEHCLNLLAPRKPEAEDVIYTEKPLSTRTFKSHAGDWMCTCGTVNPSYRGICTKCRSGRLSYVASYNMSGALAGDWICGNCLQYNYGSVTFCRGCMQNARMRFADPLAVGRGALRNDPRQVLAVLGRVEGYPHKIYEEWEKWKREVANGTVNEVTATQPLRIGVRSDALVIVGEDVFNIPASTSIESQLPKEKLEMAKDDTRVTRVETILQHRLLSNYNWLGVCPQCHFQHVGLSYDAGSTCRQCSASLTPRIFWERDAAASRCDSETAPLDALHAVENQLKVELEKQRGEAKLVGPDEYKCTWLEVDMQEYKLCQNCGVYNHSVREQCRRCGAASNIWMCKAKTEANVVCNAKNPNSSPYCKECGRMRPANISSAK